MNERTFGYIEGSTPIHRIDALSKLALVILITVAAFALPFRQSVVQLILVITFCFVGRPKYAPLLQPMVIVLGLASLLMVFQVLNFSGGGIVAQVGPIAVHEQGVERGLVFTVRVATLMLASFLFVRTTDPRALAVGLIYLRVPYRYAWMVFVSLTSLALFRSQLVIAREAQLVRGLPAGQSPIGRHLTLWRRYIQSLLVVGLRRVEIVSVAMDLRGFGAWSTRTFIDPFRWSALGLTLVALWTGVLVVAIAGGFGA